MISGSNNRPRIIRAAHRVAERQRYRWRRRETNKPPWFSGDERLQRIFLDSSVSESDRYTELFTYFVSGFLYYQSDPAHVDYPGAPSYNGLEMDAIEGFCRFLPMVAAWVSSGREQVIRVADGRTVDLVEVVRAGLLAGTDPASGNYWGVIGDYDQRIAEAADVALAIWLLRDHIWDRLPAARREQVAAWLRQVCGKEVSDNNWHLFPVLINEVLHALGSGYDREITSWHLARIREFYRGNGWFSDGPGGVYDFYNAWGIHYSLFWIGLVNPSLYPDFIDESLTKFVAVFKHVFSPEGIPITGRSICYRMAAPAPLIGAAFKELDGVSPGLARRALDAVWEHFIDHGAVNCGRVTQGFWRDDLRLLDNYSGAGSCLWSLRSLVLAFHCPESSPFWSAPLEPLPVECEDFLVAVPEIGWRIEGHRRTREVTIIKEANAGNPFRGLEPYSLVDRIKQNLLGKPYRPDNSYAKNNLQRYSSRRPFWED